MKKRSMWNEMGDYDVSVWKKLLIEGFIGLGRFLFKLWKKSGSPTKESQNKTYFIWKKLAVFWEHIHFIVLQSLSSKKDFYFTMAIMKYFLCNQGFPSHVVLGLKSKVNVDEKTVMLVESSIPKNRLICKERKLETKVIWESSGKVAESYCCDGFVVIK